MATAFSKTTTAEQVEGSTASSAVQHESACARCGGLLVPDFAMDLLFCIGETKFAAQRCVQCGEIVDPVILGNRRTKQEPMIAQLSGREGGPNIRVMYKQYFQPTRVVLVFQNQGGFLCGVTGCFRSDWGWH